MRFLASLFAALLALTPGLVSAQTAIGGFPGSNLLINPWMELDQNHEGASVTETASAAGTYTFRGNATTDGGCDGWGGTFATSASGITSVCQTAALAPNGSISDVLITVGTGSATHADGTIVTWEQRIEPYKIATLQYGTANAQPSYLQFCAKASIAGNYSFYLVGGASATTAALHTVGSSYFHQFNIPTAAVWSCYNFQIPGDTGGTWLATTNTTDTTHGATLGFVLGLNGVTTDKYGVPTATAADGIWQNGAQNVVGVNTTNVAMDKTSGSTFEITGIRWALDNAPLVHAPTFELLEAQRYFAKTFRVGTAGQSGIAPAQNKGVATAMGYASNFISVTSTAVGIPWPFPVTMRSAPAITAFSPGASTSACYDITAGAAGGATTIESGITSNATNSQSVYISCASTANTAGDRIGIGISADSRL